jgi:uncharacterized protein (DUF58 family)
MTEPLLDSEFLRELVVLRRRLVSRARSGGLGDGASPRRGGSAEFQEHRPYAPGDDPRRIDWLAYARSGVPVTKLFRAEEDTVVRVVLDASASLDFGNPTKIETSKRFAAAVSYLTLCAGHRAELALARETERGGSLEPLTRAGRGKGSAPALLRSLSAVEARGRGDLARALRVAQESAKRPGLFVVISDFLDSGPVTDVLGQAHAAGHDVALVHVLDPTELEPELGGDFALVDSETGEALNVTLDATAIETYLLRLFGLAEELRAWARRHGAVYLRMTTDDALLPVMRRFVMRNID